MEHRIHLIGRRIRLIRKTLSITQAELAQRIDKTPNYVSYLESGTKVPSIDTLIDIANALHVSSDELLYDLLDHHKEKSDSLSGVLNSCSEKERSIVIEVVQALVRVLHRP